MAQAPSIANTELLAPAGNWECTRAAVANGADAVIVQDLGLATMARAIAPDLHVHASTQMTITSPEALAFADELLEIARKTHSKRSDCFMPRNPG